VSFAVVSSLNPRTRPTVLKESIMTATYTFDVFCSLDGFGSHSGYWGKQGPELLDHRLSQHLTRETKRPAGRQPVAGEVIMTHISTTTAAVGTQ
jgi:hypothetical protein